MAASISLFYTFAKQAKEVCFFLNREAITYGWEIWSILCGWNDFWPWILGEHHRGWQADSDRTTHPDNCKQLLVIKIKFILLSRHNSNSHQGTILFLRYFNIIRHEIYFYHKKCCFYFCMSMKFYNNVFPCFLTLTWEESSSMLPTEL